MAIGIQRDAITGGIRDIGLERHMQVRDGWVHDTTAASTTEAIGKEIADGSSTIITGIATMIETIVGTGITTSQSGTEIRDRSL